MFSHFLNASRFPDITDLLEIAINQDNKLAMAKTLDTSPLLFEQIRSSLVNVSTGFALLVGLLKIECGVYIRIRACSGSIEGKEPLM